MTQRVKHKITEDWQVVELYNNWDSSINTVNAD